MARPNKYGLDYFPMQTDILSDPKITKLIKSGEQDAWTVFTFVLILTYKKCYWEHIGTVKDTIAFYFRSLSNERIDECLKILVDAELLDRDKFEEGIITSHGIQNQYSQSTTKRKSFPPDDYWLLEPHLSGVSDVNNSLKPSKCSPKPNLNRVSDVNKKQTETETETEIETETENKQKQKDADELSDSFIPDFYGVVMANLEDFGVEIRKNTENVVSRWVRDYDQRSIVEAIELAANKRARNIVGYADTVLRKWELGDGSPRWVQDEESRYASEKEEYMKSGAFAGELKGVFA